MWGIWEQLIHRLFGLGGDGVVRLRLGAGVIFLTVAAFVALCVAAGVVAWALRGDAPFALGVIAILAFVAILLFLGSWVFAHLHPDVAALGGSLYQRLREREIVEAKALPQRPQVAPLPPSTDPDQPPPPDADMLREMLRLRLVLGLGADLDKVSFQAVWHELCVSHYRGEDTSSYLINRSLMRPRNLLKIFNHCRGFATNFDRQKIEDADIEKGLKAYSADLLEELDRELTDVFPEARDLLYHFLDAPGVMTPDDLTAILTGAKVADREKVTDFLLYYGVLGVQAVDSEYFIFNVNYDLKVLKIRAERGGDSIRYIINPAFWPAFGVKEAA